MSCDVDESAASQSYRCPRLGISAIFKNEKPYIVEWLAHHRLLGVKRFFIADNESSDGTSELLEALQACGYLACYRFASPEGGGAQLPAYRMLLDRHRHEVDWLAFIDADEFIWPMGEEDSLPRFIQKLIERRPAMGALVLNWATFGSGGQLYQEPGLVVERFTRHAHQDHYANTAIKSIVRVADFEGFTCPHNVQLSAGRLHCHANGEPRNTYADHLDIPEMRCIRSEQVCWEGFRINHYAIKSFQEFEQRKRGRGRVFVPRRLNQNYFFWHDANEEQCLVSPQRIKRLHAEIFSIEAALAKVGWVDNFKDTHGCLRPPLAGRVGEASRISEGLLIRGWCQPWSNVKIVNMVAIINGQRYQAQWFKPAPILEKHLSKTDQLGPEKYLKPQAPVGSGFQAFFPLGSRVAIENLEIAGLTENGLLTQSLEECE